jgi:hypothetical protein
VDVALSIDQSLMEGVAAEWLTNHRHEFFAVATRRDRAEMFTVKQNEGTFSRAASVMRLLQDSVENRSEIAGRGVDDLQYLRGRGLLFQRLVTLGFGRVTLGSALGKFSLTLGELTFEIGYAPFGIG